MQTQEITANKIKGQEVGTCGVGQNVKVAGVRPRYQCEQIVNMAHVQVPKEIAAMEQKRRS